MTLANKFTLSRVLLAPVFFIIYFIPHRFGFGAEASVFVMVPLLAYMEFTDFLDGFYARKLNQVSDFGKLFDPFGDVLVHLTLFFCFVCDGYMMPILFILIFYREFSMLFLRMIAVKQGIAIGARKGGKAKTVLYVVAAFFTLFRECCARLGVQFGGAESVLATVSLVLFCVSLAASYASFIDYLITFKKVFKTE